MAEFNLTDNQWLEVIDDTGATRLVSLHELFTEARALRALSGDLPTQTFALLRLLLAVLQRALVDVTPNTTAEVVSQVERLEERWEELVLPAVLNYLDEWRDRFYLFHESQPFFQTPGMRTDKNDVASLARIIGDFPTGNPYLTMRSQANVESISAAEAARWLVHVQAFDTSGIKIGVVGHPRRKGGRVYPEGVAWAGQIGPVYIEGERLLETLLLNLWPFVHENHGLTEQDLPAWERPVVHIEDLHLERDSVDAARPSGPVDLMTWQPRCALLIGDASAVTGVQLTYADSFLLQERQFVVQQEPFSRWRHSKPQSAKFKQEVQMGDSFWPEVGVWQGLSGLLASSQTKREAVTAAPCLIAQHAGRFRDSKLLPNRVARLRTVGIEYGPQNATIAAVFTDALDAPALLLDADEQELRQVAIDAVGTAKESASVLGQFAGNLAQAAGGSGEVLEAARARGRMSALTALDEVFRIWLLESLSSAHDEPLRATKEWHIAAYAALRRQAGLLIEEVPDKAWTGVPYRTREGSENGTLDVGRAEVWLIHGLLKHLPGAKSRNQEDVTEKEEE